MAAILTNYDLSLGDTLSSEVVNPNNVRLQFEVADATADQAVELAFMVNDGSEYVPLVDENGREIRTVVGKDKKGSLAVQGINSASLKIRVKTITDCTGTLTLTTFES